MRLTPDEMRFYGIEEPHDTPCLEDTHLDLWRSETYVSPREKAWLTWIDQAQGIVGHDLDGNQDTDGYSLDFAHDAWSANLTPREYAAEVAEAKAKLQQKGQANA